MTERAHFPRRCGQCGQTFFAHTRWDGGPLEWCAECIEAEADLKEQQRVEERFGPRHVQGEHEEHVLRLFARDRARARADIGGRS